MFGSDDRARRVEIAIESSGEEENVDEDERRVLF